MTAHRENIHIWAISGLYWPNFSGAAIQAHRILKALICQGFTVTVLTRGEQEAFDLRREERNRDGVVIRYLPTIPVREWRSLHRLYRLQKAVIYSWTLLKRLSMSLLCTWQLWRQGRSGDIVQFYSTGEFSMLLVWLARVKGMHPAIQMNLLGSDDPGSILKRVKQGNIVAALTLESFRRAEATVGLSSALTSSYCAAGLPPERVLRIPNGVDLAEFHPVSESEQVRLRQSLGLRVDCLYIVFVGWAVHRKGIDVLIRAFIQVAPQIGEAELLVVGRSDFRGGSTGMAKEQRLINDLKAELVHAGYASRVHWVGHADNVSEYLQAADIFCFPTRREGLPNVVGEAMATGLAVVLSYVEGMTTDFVDSEDQATLVQGYDPQDYAVALMRLLEDPSLAKERGNAARERVAAEFSLDRVVRCYAQLYRELASSD